MPLTREQYEHRYTRQRILKALCDEPYGCTSVVAVREYVKKHSDERFIAALESLIKDELIQRESDTRIGLTPLFRVQQKQKKRAAAKKAREERKAARERETR